MAIRGEVTVVARKTILETASSLIKIGRRLIKTPDGVTTIYPTTIEYVEQNLVLDETDKIIDFEEPKNPQIYELQFDEIIELFMIPVTLDSGKKTTFGELLADKTDSIIENRLRIQKELSLQNEANLIKPILESPNVAVRNQNDLLVKVLNASPGIQYDWYVDEAGDGLIIYPEKTYMRFSVKENYDKSDITIHCYASSPSGCRSETVTTIHIS